MITVLPRSPMIAGALTRISLTHIICSFCNLATKGKPNWTYWLMKREIITIHSKKKIWSHKVRIRNPNSTSSYCTPQFLKSLVSIVTIVVIKRGLCIGLKGSESSVNSYPSAADIRQLVECQLKSLISLGQYVITTTKPALISLIAVDSWLWDSLIHEGSAPACW